MATVRKDGKVWVADLRPMGGQIRRCPETNQPFKYKEDAEGYITKFLNALNNGLDLRIAGKKTFGDAQVEYLKWIKRRVDARIIGDGTYDNYVNDAADVLTVNYQNKPICDVPLSKIKSSVLKTETVYEFVNNPKWSYKTAKEKWQRFKKILEIAADNDWLAASPAASISLPKEPEHQELKIDQEADEFDSLAERISRDAVAKIIDAAKYENLVPNAAWHKHEINPKMFHLLVMFAAYTGMRFGEMSALLWSSIDFDKGLIHVRRAQKKYKKVGLPKTGAGKRSIPLMPALAVELKKWKLAQPQRERHNNLVFANTNGGMCDHDQFNRTCLKRILKTNDLPEIRWHDLRHHFVSVLIFDVDVPATTIARMVGHTSVDFTVKQYANWLENRDRDLDIANKMEAAFLKRGAN